MTPKASVFGWDLPAVLFPSLFSVLPGLRHPERTSGENYPAGCTEKGLADKW
jgi:hypothetical protein